MSNACFTTYIATGRRQDTDSLYGILQQMRDNPTPLVPNNWHFANMWLGCLVHALGGDCEAVPCRGFISGFSMHGDDAISMDLETAWREEPELRHFIESRYDGMKIYYFEDASDEGIQNTNDADGKFFDTGVYIESDGTVDIDKGGRFATLEEAAAAVSELVGYEIEATLYDIEVALEEYMAEHPESWLEVRQVNVYDD